MRSMTAFLFVLLFCAHGCKSPENDTNPQFSDQEVSNAFGRAQEQAQIQIPQLDEASGLVNSRSNPIYFWSHNDSGGDPQFFLFTQTGADSSRLILNGAQNVDWEDMAIGPGPVDQVNYLYAADIGDNRAVRANCVIYRVPEPDLTVADIPATYTVNATDYETITYRYADGARDAEALFVDPATRDIYIVTKREPSVIVYRLPYPQSLSSENVAERVAVIPFTFVTAADLSADGTELLLKNYENVYYWKRSATESIQEMLSKTPLRLNYTREPQGEAIAWDSSHNAYYTISEANGSSPVVLFRYNRN